MFSKLSRRTFLAACAVPGVALKASRHEEVTLVRTPNEGLQPQAVVDRRGVVHLIYLYGDPAASDVAYVRKAPGERDFSAPIRVNDRPGSAIALGTVRGAHIALGKNDRVHVAWNGCATAEPKGPRNSAPMLYARLNDAGTAFEPQRSVMQTASGLDGGGTLAADPLGNVYVVWHAQGQREDRPIVGEGNRRVWMAKSSDNGATFARESAISPADLGACGCCGMGALADQSGNLYLLYRNARETVHRDMYLMISTDHGTTFRSTDLDPWEIGACPMSTVSLTEANGQVLLAWQTEKQVYLAPVDIHTGKVGARLAASAEGPSRKHPSIAVNRQGETLFAWTEGTGWKKGGTLAWQIFDSTGKALSSKTNAGLVPAWGFAAAVVSDGKFLLIC